MASDTCVTVHIWPGNASGEPPGDVPLAPQPPDIAGAADEPAAPSYGRAATTSHAVGLGGNVTDEEACNSFIAQTGRFTLHQGLHPTDYPLAATTGGAYACLDAKGRLNVGGDATFGAAIPDDLRAYLGAQGALTWFATERDFAALVDVGTTNRLIVWGASIALDRIRYSLSGIRAVYANRYAFAFIYEAATTAGYRIGAIGDEARGGKITEDIHLALAGDEPVSIRASESAFVVLTRAGKVYAWGEATAGGTISPDAISILKGMKVEKIFSAARAFCAVGQDGAPVTWGAADQGGLMPPGILEAILDDDGVQTIVASQAAFCSITRRRRKAIAWGSANHGGSMSSVAESFAAMGDIVACKAAACAFCAINRSGKIEAWGHASHGGVLTPAAEAGIQSAEAMPDESQQDLAADIESVLTDSAESAKPSDSWIGPSFVTPEWAAHLYACDSGFLLLTAFLDDRIRSVHAWGAADTLPSQSVRQILLGSCLDHVVSSNRAYLAALRYGARTGRVVVWGEPASSGGALPPEILKTMEHDVVEASAINRLPPLAPGQITSTASGFYILCDDGTVAFWGRATGTVVLPPAIASP